MLLLFLNPPICLQEPWPDCCGYRDRRAGCGREGALFAAMRIWNAALRIRPSRDISGPWRSKKCWSGRAPCSMVRFSVRFVLNSSASFRIKHIRPASLSMSHLLLPIIAGGRTADETETPDWPRAKLTPNSAARRPTLGERNSRQKSESHISARGPSAEPEVGDAAQ